MDDLQAIFPKAAIHLVSNGVDVEQFSPILPVYSCENTIVAVGTLRWHKGFDNLIRMFSRIALTYPQWKLKIIGDGPDKELLESIVSSHELQNKVFLCGAMGREELANELVNAKIFALSSVTEGLPKVLLEAMSANCACVAFNVGDCERVLGDAGISIKENDESAFINGMVLLMESSTLCSEFGYKANARAAQFSWEAYASVHVMLYKQALLKISSSNQREGV